MGPYWYAYYMYRAVLRRSVLYMKAPTAFDVEISAQV